MLSADTEKAKAILQIDRGNKKPRKDIAKWSDVPAYAAYFYNELYTADYTLPANIAPADAAAILKAYRDVYNPADDKDAWFQRMKDLCEPLGFTPNVKEYKANPDAYKGHVGDVSTVIRVAATSRTNTPDLYYILQILGKEEVLHRLDQAISHYEGE